MKSREIFLSQPILLELEAPLNLCVMCFYLCTFESNERIALQISEEEEEQEEKKRKSNVTCRLFDTDVRLFSKLTPSSYSFSSLPLYPPLTPDGLQKEISTGTVFNI
ncbi:unnamed protein product [Soboliphyme baturini]|uniref:STPPase_N domain-containing protein n=1 Tax=Soboliphyme baturini TaxID=241478 RepID=A0A183IV21_9BILA|nr:unnamed protein product [Soboliphyme baturini]